MVLKPFSYHNFSVYIWNIPSKNLVTIFETIGPGKYWVSKIDTCSIKKLDKILLADELVLMISLAKIVEILFQ